MGLGSDLLDALKVVRKSGFAVAAVLAADREFLGVISPKDAAVLTSFEKLRLAVADLDGCLDIPLFIGHLRPVSPLPPNVAKVILGARP
jgi:hypothetical protein